MHTPFFSCASKISPLLTKAQTVIDNKTAGTKVLETGDLEIQTDKGSYAIPASIAAADPKSNTIAAGSNKAGSAIAIAAAINSQVGVTGVSAVAGAATIGATKTTLGNTSIQTDLYVNGEKVSLSLSASHTLSQRRQYVMESINAGTTVHGVVAVDSGAGGLTLTTPDGRNLSVWYDSTSVQGSDFGLGLDTTPPSNPLGVTGVYGAAASNFGANSTVAASTVYGTVTLNSQNAFTIKPGAKAYAIASASALDPTYANFTALGFEAKTINAKSIGRLIFQVGPAANQLISIDLADFGKNGDITGLITSDRAPTNLLTVNSSNDVIINVNKSLDRIAATRATMGAVMNRLEHVIDNLTNVVMNSEASRSQIEDADYAQASTELAKTKIKQQAATAVLAQANLSSQMVLKLLEQN